LEKGGCAIDYKELIEYLDQKFNVIESRFGVVDGRFTSMDQKLDLIEERINPNLCVK